MNRLFNNTLIQFILFLCVLYFFFMSIELLGIAFKLLGKNFAAKLMIVTANPITGLFIGIISTSLVQSSSSTTAILVGLVAAGTMSIRNAIPIVMGANIGTTITNILVSLGHISRRQEFSNAMSGATVHDFFNLLSVSVFLPLEIGTHFIEHTAFFLSNLFKNVGGLTFVSPLATVVKPSAYLVMNLIKLIVPSYNWILALFVLITALVILFISLKNMVALMKKIVIGRAEIFLHQYLFNSPIRSFLLGLFLTATVQSSSATTSLIVPIVGAGILTVYQVYPYVLGTNIGTTVTALLASLVTRSPAALTVAFAHLSFNFVGTLLFYPLKIIPIKMALKFGYLVAKNKMLAPLFLIIFFFVIPLIIIVLIEGGI